LGCSLAAVLVLFAVDNWGFLLRRPKDVYVYGVSTPDSQARVLTALRQYRDACGTRIRVFFLDPDLLDSVLPVLSDLPDSGLAGTKKSTPL
jgi:hypothetical protein